MTFLVIGKGQVSGLRRNQHCQSLQTSRSTSSKGKGGSDNSGEGEAGEQAFEQA